MEDVWRSKRTVGGPFKKGSLVFLGTSLGKKGLRVYRYKDAFRGEEEHKGVIE